MNAQQVLALVLEIADLRIERDMLRAELARRDAEATPPPPPVPEAST